MTINVPAFVKTIEIDGEVEDITIEDGVLKIKVKNQIIYNFTQSVPFTPVPAVPNPWAPGVNPWPLLPWDKTIVIGDFPLGQTSCTTSTREDLRNLVAIN